jgi:hypothetical protein
MGELSGRPWEASHMANVGTSWRVRIAGLGLGVAVIAIVPGPQPLAQSAAQAATEHAPASPTRAQLNVWRRSMAVTARPKRGCFVAAYPQTQWAEVRCVAAPQVPLRPRSDGARLAQTVGDGSDFSAAVAGEATLAEGSFDSVNGVASESGNGTANAYTLQLNTGFFSTRTCSGGAAGCKGWEQFIHYNDPGSTSIGFIQYWMLGYGSPCPSGWTTYDTDCYTNSTYGVVVPTQTIATLGKITLTGTAPSGTTDDAVTVSLDGELYSVSGQSYFPDLAQHWNASEFNIFGPGNGSQAAFNAGATLVVRTGMNRGAAGAPSCDVEGFTGETNNLNLVSTPAAQIGSDLPSIVFTENYAGIPIPATCVALQAQQPATDGPMPLWTLGGLGVGLMGIASRRLKKGA